MNKEHEDLIDKVCRMFKDGTFSICGIQKRHLQEYSSMEVTENGMVRFTLERHAHLFGSPTVGFASSAYTQIDTRYEVDPTTEQIKIIETDTVVHDPVIDYDQLVQEEVESLLDYGYNSVQIEQMETEEEVREFFENEFDENLNSLDWFDDYDIPSDFKEKFRPKFRAAFIHEMIESWKFSKEYSEKENINETTPQEETTEWRKLCRDLNYLRVDIPLSGPNYHDTLSRAHQIALDGLKQAQKEGYDYLLLVHGHGSPGQTTPASIVRKLIRSKESTPYVIKLRSKKYDDVLLAAIRRKKKGK